MEVDSHATDVTGKTMLEETVRTDGAQQKCVIIEIDKMLGQSFNPVEPEFDDIAVEGRQVFLGDEVLVFHNLQLRIIYIKPFRIMTACNKKNFVNPRGESFDSPEPISEPAPVSVSVVILGNLCGGVPFTGCYPFGVVPVNPCYDKINIIFRSQS